MAIVEVTIVPLGTASTSLSPYVAEVHRLALSEPEIKAMLTPMSTILEGDLDRILALVRRMHELPYASGAERVSTSIRIDDRRDRAASMEAKLDAVNKKL